MSHIVTRECDEYACSCGLRWGVKSADPHPLTGDQCRNYVDAFRVMYPDITECWRGFDPAQPGADRTVEATYENGKLRLDSIRELIKD